MIKSVYCVESSRGRRKMYISVEGGWGGVVSANRAACAAASWAALKKPGRVIVSPLLPLICITNGPFLPVNSRVVVSVILPYGWIGIHKVIAAFTGCTVNDAGTKLRRLMKSDKLSDFGTLMTCIWDWI